MHALVALNPKVSGTPDRKRDLHHTCDSHFCVILGHGRRHHSADVIGGEVSTPVLDDT